MLPKSWFQPSLKDTAALRLLARVTTAARDPALYRPGALPDTMDGRFEALTLMACVLLTRLKGEARAERVAQAFTDRLFRHVDAGLRESGVGDLSVPKKMKVLAASFYGRLGAYGPALTEENGAALSAAMARNIWQADGPHAGADALSAHALALFTRLRESPLEAIEAGETWNEQASAGA
jgi:cytochrome b pre-mRNA-processing protein 3